MGKGIRIQFKHMQVAVEKLGQVWNVQWSGMQALALSLCELCNLEEQSGNANVSVMALLRSKNLLKKRNRSWHCSKRK